jgi:hypothetical protein
MTGGHPNAFVAGDSFRCSGPRPRDAEGILPQFGQAFCGSKFDVHREWRARLRPLATLSGGIAEAYRDAGKTRLSRNGLLPPGLQQTFVGASRAGDLLENKRLMHDFVLPQPWCAGRRAAASAPSAPTRTTGNQGADWLEMRRAAGWGGLGNQARWASRRDL